MGLDLRTIKEAVRERRKGQILRDAKLHQDRIKFHTIKRFAFDPDDQGYQYLAWIANLLPKDKFKTFKALFRYPVKTNEVTGACFNKLSRVFDGRNPVFKYEFINSEWRNDWEEYRTTRLHEPAVWSTKAWEYFKTEINSVLVVDVPSEQTSLMPEPYFYFVTIDRIIDYATEEDRMRYIIFTNDDDDMVVIDDKSYRVFRGEECETLVSEHPHDLGYCPARFFWTEPIDIKCPDIKMSPLTPVLNSLDWYLFFNTSKKHLDMFGAYPIYSGYQQDCNFEAENGDYCDAGFLRDKEGHRLYDQAGLPMACPKCSNKRIIGAGSFVEVPVPSETEGVPDMRNPVQMLAVDKNSLTFNVEEDERLRKEIISIVVGDDDQITGIEALNEQQIMANLEDQTAVLNRIKKGFESAQMFVDETVCRLRYGTYFMSSYINYGTDFYLSSADALRERYRKAKESGATEAELDALQGQIVATEYRNDLATQKKMMILHEIEPFRHLTFNELESLHEKGLISDVDLKTKLNFSEYINRFEREHGSISSHMERMPYETLVEEVKKTIRSYAGE